MQDQNGQLTAGGKLLAGLGAGKLSRLWLLFKTKIKDKMAIFALAANLNFGSD